MTIIQYYQDEMVLNNMNKEKGTQLRFCNEATVYYHLSFDPHGAHTVIVYRKFYVQTNAMNSKASSLKFVCHYFKEYQVAKW